MLINEAKEKQCRMFSQLSYMRCSANQCMHWRWHEAEPGSGRDWELSTTDGYCGLSGKDGAK